MYAGVGIIVSVFIALACGPRKQSFNAGIAAIVSWPILLIAAVFIGYRDLIQILRRRTIIGFENELKDLTERITAYEEVQFVEAKAELLKKLEVVKDYHKFVLDKHKI